MARTKLPLGQIGYWVAAGAVTLMGWSIYSATQAFDRTSREVGHTLEVLDHISNVDESVSRAEAGQRGYLLTGEAQFAAERDTAIQRTTNEVARLRELTSDNPAQQDRLRELERLVADRVQIMRENALLRDIGGAPAIAERVTGRGREASNRLFAITQQLDNEEQKLLADRRSQADKDHQRTLLMVGLAIAVSLGLMVPGYIAYIHEARARNLAEARLLDMANSLPGAVYRLRTRPDGGRQFEFLGERVSEMRMVDREAAEKDFGLMWNTIVEQDRALVANAMAEAERQLLPAKYDFRVRTEDHAPRWLRASATLRREPDGSVLWNGYWSDVTLEKRLQVELQEAMAAAQSANRAKSTFLATMSHEIRTPMNGVLGMLELLDLTRLDNQQRATLAVIRESSRSLLRIIDDILDFSKIEAGKLDVRLEVSSLADLVERVCNVYSGNASSKGLTLRRFFDSRISPAVMVDPLRLQQILNNFVSNAIKFTHQGEIEVRADLAEREAGRDVVRFTVRDTGIGVSEQDKQRLFAPFSQATESIAHRYGGTGLGLAICRRLAAMMGGVIEMESVVAKGTAMTLTIALEVARPESLASAAQKADVHALASMPGLNAREAPGPEAARDQGTLLLIVDDHPINRMVLLRQVNALGYAGEVAENGLDAITSWSRGGIAAIITDCHMPEMNGYELARHVRSHEKRNGNAHVPIIACTANALAGEAANCLAAGMDDYLAKPIDLQKLSVKLERWLGTIEQEQVSQPEPPVSVLRHFPSLGANIIHAPTLASISGGDAEVERDLLARFRRYNSEDGYLLMNAVQNRDMEEIRHASHRIKGACRTIGALGLAAVCDRIERASRASDWPDVIAHMDEFRDAFDLLNSHIAALECSSETAARPQMPRTEVR